MYASIGSRKNALKTLSEIARLKQENVAGYERVPWEKIYYETGNLQFWFDDLDGALANLKKVTGTPEQLKELDLNTGVLALMRQGQIYDLENHHNLAIQAYHEAVKFAPEAEAARESHHYINSPYTRPVAQSGARMKTRSSLTLIGMDKARQLAILGMVVSGLLAVLKITAGWIGALGGA